MKLVLLMYLEDDEACVERLLVGEGVAIWSRLPIEGHRPGRGGWYGGVAPYRSRLDMVIVDEDAAERLLAAVEGCRGVADPAHPIRAVLVDVEKVASCLCEKTGEPRPDAAPREP